MAGIYIHIPFCKKACHYCDFYFSTSLKYKTEMLEAILQEIALQKKFLKNQTIHTIYFGGGTPSVLSGSDLSRIIDAIYQNFTVAPQPEITLEANPDDLNNKKIKEIKKTQINRFSIGIQSFFDDDLKWMNRAHISSEGEGAIKRAQDNGFDNLNIDLIYGFPLLTPNKWNHNLQKAIEFKVAHISAYALTVEPKTALAVFIKNKQQIPINEQQSAAQFLVLMHVLCKAAYQHYEISNFCLSGMQSQHNTNYWQGVHYLGIGPSAHSFNGLSRQWNVANNIQYLSALAKKEIPQTNELLTLPNQINEYIMTSIRTIWGIDLIKIALNYGPNAHEKIKQQTLALINKGLLINKNGIVTLTTNGKLYADGIAVDLFIDDDFMF
jgi:oxygen-independent coproporphyrinogen-3 oxidase